MQKTIKEPLVQKDKIGSTTILYKKEFSTQKPELSNFKEGISFDLSDYVKDFFTQDIADKIANNMEPLFSYPLLKDKVSGQWLIATMDGN